MSREVKPYNARATQIGGTYMAGVGAGSKTDPIKQVVVLDDGEGVAETTGNPVDRSGVAGGDEPTTIMTASSSKRRISIQLPSIASGSIWYSELGDATIGPPSYEIKPGEILEDFHDKAVSVIADDTPQPFAAREYL